MVVMADQYHSQAHKPQPNRLALGLMAGAVVLIAASVVLLVRYGPAGYFAATGRPWQWPPRAPAAAKAVMYPKFTTTQSIGQPQVSAGGQQTITVTPTSDQTTTAEVHVWVTSPAHKEIWRSPADELTSFVAGKAVVKAFTFTLPATAAPGKYSVSYQLVSQDGYSDYAVNDNFGEFSVQ